MDMYITCVWGGVLECGVRCVACQCEVGMYSYSLVSSGDSF